MPNGYGSVYKMGGKRRKPFIARRTTGWEINSKTGNAVQTYDIVGYYESRQLALIALAEYNANPYDLKGAKTTFAEMYEYFIAQSQIIKLSNSSKLGYSAAFKRCQPIHNMKFIDIKKPHLQACIDDIDDAGWSTRKKVKVLYNQLYKLAREMDVIEKDYSEFVDIGANDTPAIKVPFTANEINIIKQHVGNIEYLDTILILLYSGMRVSEMLDIKTADVDIDGEIMRGGNKTYAGINRIIPIHPLIMPYIKKYYNLDNKYLITYPNGGHIGYANYRDTYWDKIMVALNMEHLPHECRHTFISLMDSAGANPTVIKRIVGHAGKGITEKVYTHKDIVELKAGIRCID